MAEEASSDEFDFEADESYENMSEENGSTVTTTLLTGAAVAILAPELLPGMAIGIAAIFAPRFFPVIGNVMRPLVKTAVRTSYNAALKTREMMAEASEQMQDIVAEARSEQGDTKPVRRSRRKPAHATKQNSKK